MSCLDLILKHVNDLNIRLSKLKLESNVNVNVDLQPVVDAITNLNLSLVNRLDALESNLQTCLCSCTQVPQLVNVEQGLNNDVLVGLGVNFKVFLGHSDPLFTAANITTSNGIVQSVTGDGLEFDVVVVPSATGPLTVSATSESVSDSITITVF